MYSRSKEFIIPVVLIFLNLIQNINSYFAVEQCPGTDVSNIRLQTHFNEISLIFYYTQWSEESLEALQQFNDVAEVFGEEVYFAAIDCWHLSCNCSNTLARPMGSGYPLKWPTLIVHYGRLGQLKIQYNGLFTFRNIIDFVMNIMQPLERVQDRKDLEKIKTSADAVVLGVFENSKRVEYNSYLFAALKWLEHDPKRTYRFIVTFTGANEILNKTNVKESNILLFSPKTKKSFADYSDFNWSGRTIIRWLNEEFSDEYSLLHGYNTPITIAQKMSKQPVLAVFVNDPQKFFSYMEKYVDNQKPFSKALLACENDKKRKAKIKKLEESLRNSNFMRKLANFRDATKCNNYQRDMISKNLQYYYEINQYLELQSRTSFYKTNLEVHRLLSFFKSMACLGKKDISLETSLHINIVKRLEGYLTNEQHCKASNRSMSAVLLDAERYKDFLKSHNILPDQQSMATVFIIDNAKENIYVMEDRFAMFNLMEFVKKFYSNALNNYFKNNPTTSPHSQPSSRDYDVELSEFNRDIFLKHLQYAHNQTLVVLIYSPDCALCGNIQHSFIQLSLYLRNIVDLKFIRINAMDNDLPWQFSMPFLPTLMVFPENRFSESRVFPTHLKPDVRNVFGFILGQLSAHQQIKILLAMCKSGTLPRSHIQSCWQFAKTILMQHIGKHLQYWQIFESERNLIFERLRAFKDFSLDTQRNLRL